MVQSDENGAVLQNHESPQDQGFSFQRFVVGKANEFAYCSALRVASVDRVYFNPLVLCSDTGLGKSHLMRAIALHLNQLCPQRQVLYFTGGQFIEQIDCVLLNQNTMSIKDVFQSVDVLMIDGLYHINGTVDLQEKILCALDVLVDERRQVILSMDSASSDMDFCGQLRSRFKSCRIAKIKPADKKLRRAILQQTADRLGVEVLPHIIDFLVHKIKSNVRDLDNALSRVVAHSQLVGRIITLESARGVLGDLLK